MHTVGSAATGPEGRNVAQEYTNMLVEHDGRIGRIIINRPEKHNALLHQAVYEFPRAIDELTADDEVRVIIMKGAGPSFSSGFDWKVIERPGRAEDAVHEVLTGRDWLHGLFKIWDTPKPVIAQLHGYAAGWGSLPLLFCDLRYAAPDFKVFKAAGVTGAYLGEVWAWFVGTTAAKEYTFRPTNKLTADELYNYGLLNRIYPQDELEARVEEIAAEIATAHPLFLQLQKLGLNRQIDMRGFRESVLQAKDFDAMLHWSVLGRANMVRLRHLGGDRRRLAEEQEDTEAYWKAREADPRTTGQW